MRADAAASGRFDACSMSSLTVHLPLLRRRPAVRRFVPRRRPRRSRGVFVAILHAADLPPS